MNHLTCEFCGTRTENKLTVLEATRRNKPFAMMIDAEVCPNCKEEYYDGQKLIQFEKAMETKQTMKSKEKEIQKYLKHYEIERRKQFEERLKLEIENEERKLRGENLRPDFDDKDYEIQFIILSSRMPHIPMYFYSHPVDHKFNEFEFASLMEEEFDRFLDSNKFRKIQRKFYYKLRMLEYDEREIYEAIERHYEHWDSKTQKRFRNKMSKYFNDRQERKKTKG
ncbi:MAG: hypothetical protein ACR2J3_01370 [Aridibacter sp.]